MKKYKHRHDGYIVDVEKTDLGNYHIRGYRNTYVAGDTYLGHRDLNRLFEPVPEFCCDEFERCVNEGSFVRDIAGWKSGMTISERLWESISYCQFCGRKPL